MSGATEIVEQSGQWLANTGISESEARAKAQLFARCHQALAPNRSATVEQLFVPGRVEFLGKHTDYAGGRSLLLAAERGICVTFTACEDPVLHAIDVTKQKDRVIPLTSQAEGMDGHWSTYAAAVCRRIARNFPMRFRGVKLAFLGDLPMAAGLSSSSALIVAFFLALSEVNQLTAHSEYQRNIQTPEELAAYLGTVENGHIYKSLMSEKGVGTLGGSQDHTAILCASAGHLSQYAFSPVTLERTISFPDDYCLVIASSGVRAEKSGAARADYNGAAMRVRALLEIWNNQSGRQDLTLADAIASGPDAYTQLRSAAQKSQPKDFSGENLRQRLDQFYVESEKIIPATAAALAEGRIQDVGTLVEESQHAAKNLANQIPQTLELVKLAKHLGAPAASAFGAGWGGSVWALFKKSEAREIRPAWQDAYAKAFPENAAHSEFFTTAAGPPAQLKKR